MGAYSVRDAARILKVKPARLRYWKRTQLVRSRDGVDETDGAGFDFQDLVYARALLSLLDGGVPLQRIRQSVEILRQQVPELEEPLAALRLWDEAGGRIVVRHDGRLLEPEGQLVLEFDGEGIDAPEAPVASLPRPAAEVVEVEGVEGAAGCSALDWFETGCGLDSDPATYDRAIASYRNAVALDPLFADAHCNLGAALYNKGERSEARRCFERCLVLQPKHVEALFNIANLLDEEGDARGALERYRQALEGDPFYADLHINLALLYEKLGRDEEGRAHWRRYLQIEPSGALADIARQRLRDA